jgi:ABC-2 type transport system permease protein
MFVGRAFHAAFLRELGFLRTSKWDLGLNTLLPVLSLVLMGWLFVAATPRDMPIVAVDQDHSALSRDMLAKLDATPAIGIAYACADLACALPLVRSGRAFGVFFVPKDAGREVKAGRKARFVIFTNASYFTASIMVARDAANAVNALNAELMVADVARANLKSAGGLPVGVQSTTLFNPFSSYEWMIVSLLHPALIVIFFSCATIVAAGREIAGGTLHEWIGAPRNALFALAGKCLPYVLIYLLYAIACIFWLIWRGYPVNGSLAMLLAGYVLMLIAYIGLGVLIVAVLRDMPMALGSAALYASSALAFSGTFFPMRYGVLFAQSWNAVQPFTWYARLSMQQWQMGAPLATSLMPLGILLALAVSLGGGAVWALAHAAREEAA